ncbi:MAG: hypothetical protein LBL47_00140 [Lactobacillus sp.]|jgi:hypothetical protein|nr:hypothetical protein [Lactobacillus sp.]
MKKKKSQEKKYYQIEMYFAQFTNEDRAEISPKMIDLNYLSDGCQKVCNRGIHGTFDFQIDTPEQGRLLFYSSNAFMYRILLMDEGYEDIIGVYERGAEGEVVPFTEDIMNSIKKGSDMSETEGEGFAELGVYKPRNDRKYAELTAKFWKTNVHKKNIIKTKFEHVFVLIRTRRYHSKSPHYIVDRSKKISEAWVKLKG